MHLQNSAKTNPSRRSGALLQPLFCLNRPPVRDDAPMPTTLLTLSPFLTLTPKRSRGRPLQWLALTLSLVVFLGSKWREAEFATIHSKPKGSTRLSRSAKKTLFAELNGNELPHQANQKHRAPDSGCLGRKGKPLQRATGPFLGVKVRNGESVLYPTKKLTLMVKNDGGGMFFLLSFFLGRGGEGCPKKRLPFGPTPTCRRSLRVCFGLARRALRRGRGPDPRGRRGPRGHPDLRGRGFCLFVGRRVPTCFLYTGLLEKGLERLE